MIFLRLTVLLIIVFGAIVYLFSTRLRAEFLKTGENTHPKFIDHRSVYRAFCKNPPTPYVEKLVSVKKKFTIALIVAVVAFFLSILSVVYQQSL